MLLISVKVRIMAPRASRGGDFGANYLIRLLGGLACPLPRKKRLIFNSRKSGNCPISSLFSYFVSDV
jgi:hypothetical protein